MSHKFDSNKEKKANAPDQQQETQAEFNEESLELDYPSRGDLENQLTAMEMKVNEFKSQALRSLAELDNIRRRSEKDISNAHRYGNEKLIQDILPAMDSLNHSLAGTEPLDPKLKAMREGMAMVLKMLEKALTKHGIEIIEPKKGENFDPEKHQAMSSISDPNMNANTIVEVMQKGYILNGRVLRAALVIVAQ